MWGLEWPHEKVWMPVRAGVHLHSSPLWLFGSLDTRHFTREGQIHKPDSCWHSVLYLFGSEIDVMKLLGWSCKSYKLVYHVYSTLKRKYVPALLLEWLAWWKRMDWLTLTDECFASAKKHFPALAHPIIVKSSSSAPDEEEMRRRYLIIFRTNFFFVCLLLSSLSFNFNQLIDLLDIQM